MLNYISHKLIIFWVNLFKVYYGTVRCTVCIFPTTSYFCRKLCLFFFAEEIYDNHEHYTEQVNMVIHFPWVITLLLLQLCRPQHCNCPPLKRRKLKAQSHPASAAAHWGSVEGRWKNDQRGLSINGCSRASRSVGHRQVQVRKINRCSDLFLQPCCLFLKKRPPVKATPRLDSRIWASLHESGVNMWQRSPATCENHLAVRLYICLSVCPRSVSSRHCDAGLSVFLERDCKHKAEFTSGFYRQCCLSDHLNISSPQKYIKWLFFRYTTSNILNINRNLTIMAVFFSCVKISCSFLWKSKLRIYV